MKSRLLALCMLFVLIIALVPGVMAQDTTICGNLSADDCTALTTAFTNTGAAGSGAFTLTSTIDIQSDDPTQAAKVDITADGKFSGVKPMSMTDMTAMSADPTAAIAQFTEGIKGFSGTLNLTVGLPTTAAAMTGGEPLTLNLILVNGVGYLDFSKLPATITPMLQAYKIPTGRAGLDLVDTLTNAGGMLAGMASGNTTGATPSTSTEDMAKAQAVFVKYLQYTHDGDTYTGTVDLKGLFTDADFQAMMKSADTSKEMTAEQQAAIDSLDDATVQVAFTLAGDKLGEVNLTIDLPGSTITALNAASADSSDSTATPPTAVNITFDLKYSGLGEAQTIAAPDGAPVAKFADLMALMQGSMASSSS